MLQGNAMKPTYEELGDTVQSQEFACCDNCKNTKSCSSLKQCSNTVNPVQVEKQQQQVDSK
jgi:hypothetical protein